MRFSAHILGVDVIAMIRKFKRQNDRQSPHMILQHNHTFLSDSLAWLSAFAWPHIDSQIRSACIQWNSDSIFSTSKCTIPNIPTVWISNRTLFAANHPLLGSTKWVNTFYSLAKNTSWEVGFVQCFSKLNDHDSGFSGTYNNEFQGTAVKHREEPSYRAYKHVETTNKTPRFRTHASSNKTKIANCNKNETTFRNKQTKV